MEGSLKPDTEVNTFYDLSQGNGEDVGLGTQAKGPWNDPKQWNVIEDPETELSNAVHGPTKRS